MPTQDELSNMLIEKDKKIQELFSENRQLMSEKDEAIRKSALWDRWHQETFGRFKSRIGVAYYMLEELAAVGTHHEKEVNIRYIRSCLSKFMNDDAVIFGDEYRDLMPF